MTTTDIDQVTSFACEMANKYNKSITYVLDKIHKGLERFSDVEKVKQYVIEEMEGVNE